MGAQGEGGGGLSPRFELLTRHRLVLVWVAMHAVYDHGDGDVDATGVV